MNALEKLFSVKKKNVLNIYFTAGFPALDSTEILLNSLEDGGADIIEIGMPYSDPIADGTVIQESNMAALQNGITIELLFSQLSQYQSNRIAAGKAVAMPLVLMGYMNPVLQYGLEKFVEDAAQVGISGIILPDLPAYEFEKVYQPLFLKFGISFIFLVTPDTPEDRIKYLDNLSGGFLYAVSSSATTGGNTNTDAVTNYVKKLQQLQLKNPVLVGFGIKDAASFNMAAEHANGAIIGSAFITAISNANDIAATAKNFITAIRN